MATIGVKYNDSGIGTDLAKIMAKALYNDPKDEIDIAKMREYILSARSGRQVDASQIGKLGAEQAAVVAENLRKQQEADAIRASGPVRGKQIFDAQFLNDPAAAPAIVELPPDPTIPVPYASPGVPPVSPLTPSSIPPPTVEPDFTYQHTAYPLHSDPAMPDMPVPVEAEPSYALPPMPEQLQGLPSFEPPIPVEPQNPLRRVDPWLRVGPFGDDPNQAPWLELGGTEPEMPAIVEPTYLPEFPEQFGPPTPEAGYGDMPIPVDTNRLPFPQLPPDVPPELQPITGEGGVTDTLVGREVSAIDDGMPVPVELPPDPNASILPEATGAPLPEGAAVPPPQVLPGTTTDNGDGTVTHTTERGPVRLSRQDADKLGLAAAYAADPAGQVQQEAGTAGLLYNPDVDLSATEKIATLAGGGTAIGKDSAATQAGTPDALPGSAEGTGEAAYNTNQLISVADKIRNGQPITASEADGYAIAYNNRFATKPDVRLNADGQLVPVMIPQPQDPSFPTPDAVRQMAAGGTTVVPSTATPAPAPAPPAAVPAPAATTPPPAPVASPAAPVAAPAATPSGGVQVGQPLTDKKKTAPTKEQADSAQYYLNTKSADEEIKALKTLPDWAVLTATDPLSGGGPNANLVERLINNGVDNYVRKKHPEVVPYWGATMNFASAILRQESGAATRPEDMKTIMARYIPNAQDNPADIEAKAQRRQLAMEGLKISAFNTDDPAKRMAEVDAYVEKNIKEMAATRDAAAPAAAAPKEKLYKMVDGVLTEVPQ